MKSTLILRRHYHASGHIEKLRSGRQIAVLGNPDTYIAYLEKIQKYKDYIRVTMIKDKATNDRIFIEDIKDQADKYYLVVPAIQKSKSLLKKLKDFGYDDFKDVYFMNHGKIVIPRGTKEYSDDYGNHIRCPGFRTELDPYTCNINIDIDSSCTQSDHCNIFVRHFGGSTLKIGKGCKIHEYVTFTLAEDSEIIIGENCRLGHYLNIVAFDGNKIHIGNNCIFAKEVKIYSGDGHGIFDTVTKERLNPPATDHPKNIIEIGDYVWVGMRAIIMNRCLMDNSCIVGAGSVVKGRYPNNCAIGGNPARIVRRNVVWCISYEYDNISECPYEYILPTEEL